MARLKKRSVQNTNISWLVPPSLLPSAQPLALRRSVTFQQPISFFIVTDRWRKTWLLSTTPNKRLPSIHSLKNFGFTPLNLLGLFVARSSPMANQGMFNPQLTSINRRFLEIQGISSFFGPPRCRVCCQIMRLNTHGAAASSQWACAPRHTRATGSHHISL